MKLSDAWQAVVDRAKSAGWSMIDARVPLARVAVIRAAPQIADLCSALQRPIPVAARDVARVQALLTDGRSPVYRGGDLQARLSDLIATLREPPDLYW